MRAARDVESLDDQRERRRNQQCGTDALQHPERDQLFDGAGNRTQPGCHREQHHAPDEQPLAPEQVGELARRDEECRKDDVVGVEDPGQAADGVGRK